MSETIPALFARQAATLASKPLFHVKRQGTYQPITWQQASDDVQALATYLLQHQIAVGDRVVILSENRPEWGIADLAIQSVGAWTVPLYPSLTADDVRLICAHCQPVLAIASTEEQARKLLAATATVSSLHTILLVDPGTLSHALLTSWHDAREQGRALEPRLQTIREARSQQIQPEHTATLLYTSGTTGEPKGVMLSHRNLLSNVEACLQVIPVSGADVHLSFLPLSHVFERMAGWYLMLSVGASVAYAENMDTIPKNMLEVRPTIMLGVPRFFEKLYARIQEGLRTALPLKRAIAVWALAVGRRASAYTLAQQPLPLLLRVQHLLAGRLVYQTFRQRLGGRLRFFVSGSAPLAKEIGEFFYSIGVTILEGYGLTETSPVIAVNRLDALRFDSVGKTVPGVEVSFAPDGEILTRGPHVMQGYYENPSATAAAIVEGWFHTGDIGYDEGGWLFVTDRKKDLIKTAGGKFVAPQKLEQLFMTDPSIAQALVYGDRQPYCVALIVPAPQTLAELVQRCHLEDVPRAAVVRDPRVVDFYWQRIHEKQQHLASFEQIKKIALLDHELTQAGGELTPTMKAKRNLIGQQQAVLLASLYQPTASVPS